MNQIERVEPDLEKLERAVSAPVKMPPAKSFAPVTQRGIHELIDELEGVIELALSHLKVVKQRMAEFDRLQAGFYNGSKP